MASGCSQQAAPGSIGYGFNQQGGGTFAADWDPKAGHMRIWNWPKGLEPLDVIKKEPQPEQYLGGSKIWTGGRADEMIPDTWRLCFLDFSDFGVDVVDPLVAKSAGEVLAPDSLFSSKLGYQSAPVPRRADWKG